MRRSSSHLLLVRFLVALVLVAVGTIPAAAVPQNKKTRTTKPATARNANYPKIHAAISSLEAARAELQRADSDFGGHKTEAIESINNTLKRLRLALQFEKY